MNETQHDALNQRDIACARLKVAKDEFIRAYAAYDAANNALKQAVERDRASWYATPR